MLAYRYLREDEIAVTNDPDRPDLLRLGETTIPMFKSDEGGYHQADEGGYQYLLDFAVGHGGFPSFTLTDLYSNSIPDGALRGKIVILGTESATVKDEFYSPLSAGLPDNSPFLLGMEAHAHAAIQLIRSAQGEARPMISWEERAEYGWILLWCVLGGALGCWKRSGWHTTAATAMGLIVLVISVRVAFKSALWIPLIPPLLAAVIAAGLVTAYRAVMERTERRELTGLFSRFLRPEVAELIWEQRDQFMGPDERPRAQSIVITSLMSDLQGYTTASESMSPEALMAWVNEYMNTMANLVADFHGNVDDYAGDGIKANFGFPIPSSTEEAIAQDARNAVDCALAMGEAMNRLNESWRQRNLPTSRTRIGIFTGPAVMGFLGGGKSLKWTTVGDTINTAARLEGFAKDEFGAEEGAASWRLLIGEGTFSHLSEVFHTEDLGPHVLKGKHEAVRIFRIFGSSIRDDPPPESGPRKETKT
jgi:adenylate cyclase